MQTRRESFHKVKSVSSVNSRYPSIISPVYMFPMEMLPFVAEGKPIESIILNTYHTVCSLLRTVVAYAILPVSVAVICTDLR
ncbi:hypothetical protein CEXT_602541 [Caerostris extrusa]|uniref:Uncharacterized protein n=1 Tax=Caerostris extrusa TaxID=172846 RepID=A0AAV4SB71_CAEEX|nr:hypothetical protein CEXT_602541 [Caerostris extrusa]